jgi:hypothetical protein
MRKSIAPYDRSLRFAVQAICLLAALQARLVAQGPPEVPSIESLLDPPRAGLKIADVGPLSISGLEFKLNYEFGPAFVKRAGDSKLRYLNFMVYEKLLALEAVNNGLDRWPDVQRQTAEIEGDLATEELYKDDVLKHVFVSDRMIADGIEAERVQLSIQWIFTPDAEQMKSIVKKLKSGVPYDSLYNAQFQAGVLQPSDRSMDMSRFKLRMKNPLFASIVDTLPAGAVALPVHVPDGWYCVRVTDISRNQLLTETEYAKLHEDVKRAIVQHLSDSLSDAYIRTVVGSHEPVILRAPLNAVEAYLGRLYLDSARFNAWKLRDLKGAERLADASDLSPIAGDTLVAMSDGRFTVRDFLEWFRLREPYATLALSSPTALLHSTENMVWRMVRDRLLTQKAFARGLRDRPLVKRQVEWWREKMLYTAEKHRIGDTIVDSLPALRAYYHDNEQRFADSLGHARPFEDVRDDVWKAYYADELTKKMLHEILRLRQQYGVKIDQAALGKIPVDNENDPRTVDIYPVKKGGIYPHAAFPSIDYDWQSWN